ncbi:major outer sheath C-terminal domain-containing protein, partial [Treponema pallidum]
PGAGFRFSFALDAGNQHQSEATAAMRTERTRERAQEVALAIFTHAAQEQAKQAADTVGSTIDNSVQVARSVITQIAEGAVKQAHDQIKRTNGTQVVNIDVTVPVNVRQSPVRQPDLPSLTAIAAQLPNVTKLFFLSAGAAAARPIIGQITGVVQNVITQQVQARVAQSTAVAIQQVLVFNQQTVAAEKANTQKHTINGKSYAAHIGSLVSLATNRALPTIRQRVEQAVQENIRRINAVVQQKAQTLTSSQELEKAVYSLFVPTFENLVLGAGALLALLDMHQIAVDALFTAQWKWLSSGIYVATAP